MRLMHSILIFVLSFFSSFVIAQTNEKVSVLPFMDHVEFYCTRLQQDYYTISQFEVGYVTDAQSKFSLIKLAGGREYNILLIGEQNRIVDLDLRLHAKANDQWYIVKDINNATNILETKYRPEVKDFYEFEIMAPQFSPGHTVGRYCLIIAFR